MKQKQEKQQFIELLKKMPIIQVACSKSSISKSTYYRWRHDDQKFKQLADQALMEGISLMNDLAESQLITLVKGQNLGAIMYWLRHRHPAYNNKLEITNSQPEVRDKLTPAETKLLKSALRLSRNKHPRLAEPLQHYEKHESKE